MPTRNDPKELKGFSSDSINENQVRLNEMDWSREETKVIRMHNEEIEDSDEGELEDWPDEDNERFD